jgi:hypothetical protein
MEVLTLQNENLVDGPHNILLAQARRPFLTVQKSIQQHPRSAATLDSHDL